MTLGEFKKLVKLGRSVGAVKIKAGDFEMEFPPWSMTPQTSVPTDDKTPTEEDMLYWSSGFDPKDIKQNTSE